MPTWGKRPANHEPVTTIVETRTASHDYRTHDAEPVHRAKIRNVMLLTDIVTVVTSGPLLVLVTFMRPIAAFPSFVPGAIFVMLLHFVPGVIFVPFLHFMPVAIFVMVAIVAMIAVFMPVGAALVLVVVLVPFVPGIAIMIVIVLGKGRDTGSYRQRH